MFFKAKELFGEKSFGGEKKVSPLHSNKISMHLNEMRSSTISSLTKKLIIKKLCSKKIENTTNIHHMKTNSLKILPIKTFETSNELNKKFLISNKKTCYSNRSTSQKSNFLSVEKTEKKSVFGLKIQSYSNFEQGENCIKRSSSFSKINNLRSKYKISVFNTNYNLASSRSSFSKQSSHFSLDRRFSIKKNNIIKPLIPVTYTSESDNNWNNIVINQTNVGHSFHIFKEEIKQNDEIFKNIKILNEKFNFLSKIENENLEREINSDKKYDYMRATDYQLTEYEIETLIKELKKTDDLRELEIVDTIIKRLKFFIKFPKIIRQKLIKVAKLVQYPSNFKLFGEGDEGEHMYIILKGAINVFKKMKDYQSGKVNEILVSALYDGDHFGELAMLNKAHQKNLNSLEILESVKCFEDILKIQYDEARNLKLDQKKDILRKINEIEKFQNDGKILSIDQETFLENHNHNYKLNLEIQIKKEEMEIGVTKSKRLATVKISESSYLMQISGDNYRSILFNVIKTDLEFKIKILMHLPFFQRYEPYGLIAIANYLVFNEYKLGEVVLAEKEEIQSLYIICKGRCKVVKEIETTRPILNSKNFDNNKNSIECKEIKRVFENRIIYNSNDSLIYKEFIDYKILSVGDCFGGRAIIGNRLTHLHKTKNNFINLNLNVCERAKLSVIADEKEVNLFKFDAKNLCLIPEILKNTFVNGLAEMREYDDFDSDDGVMRQNNWNLFKLKSTKPFISVS